MVRTAVIVMTHRFDKSILDEFQRIRDELGETDRAFLLSDGSAPTPALVAQWTHTFDYAQASRRAARVIGNDILRNVHLAWIDFFASHPEFDAYWFIEYDVLYSGSWNELFDAFRDLPFDLLCTHLRPYADEPEWYWWPEVCPPDHTIPGDQLVRGFLPIARLSKQGFELLFNAVKQGWTGFLEGLIPTLFRTAGLRIGDIGGDGPFVPEGFRNRFYTSVTDPAGSLMNLGTMRYRPPILFPRIMPGRLYHPVKPDTNSFDAGVNQPRLACAALGHALRMIRGQRSPAQGPLFRKDAHADLLLQTYTGLRSAELLEALSRMETGGLENMPIEALRQSLLAFINTQDPILQVARYPVGRFRVY